MSSVRTSQEMGLEESLVGKPKPTIQNKPGSARLLLVNGWVLPTTTK